MSKSAKKIPVFFIYLALALGTIAVFWQVRNFDFTNYDDNLYVTENQHVLSGLTVKNIVWAFTTGHTGYWHPLTWLSLMLDCQLFGANPGSMHLVNLLLHIINTLLLFAILKKTTSAFWPSAFVAAAFALHPMHVESVAWIAERKDVLSTLFLLLILAAYIGYVRRRSLFSYVLTVVLFVFGLLAKPMLITLPFVLLLFDYWPLNRFTPQTIKTSGRKSGKPAPVHNERAILYRIIIEKTPFFAFSIVLSTITFLIQWGSGIAPDVNILSLSGRVANALLSYTRYIDKMFWPQNLAVFYPFDISKFSYAQIALCAILLLVISIFVIVFGRKQKYLLFGWFWFIITLVPVIGLVQSGSQAYADRYTYVSYIGLFVMVAWGLPQLVAKWRHRKIAFGVLMPIVLTILGICAYRQTSYWKNSITLFSHALEVTQNNYIAHYNLGIVYDKLGRWQEALDDFSQAVRIKPDYVKAYNNLGAVYGKLGRYQDATEAFSQAIKIKPDIAEAHNNFGIACNKLGRYQEAIEAFGRAVKIKPDYAETHYNLGYTYLVIGDKNSALAEYNILKSLNSEFANNLFKEINK